MIFNNLYMIASLYCKNYRKMGIQKRKMWESIFHKKCLLSWSHVWMGGKELKNQYKCWNTKA